MANTITTQILVDGPKNVVVKIDGFVDTSDLASTVLLDPATLSVVDSNGTKATKLRIDKIVYDIEDQLSCNLSWDATTPVLIWHLLGRNKLEFDKKYGGLQNNGGAGVTGKITMVTQGWSASAILSFSILMECTKQWVPNV